MKKNIFALIAALTAVSAANAAVGGQAPVDVTETAVGEIIIDNTGTPVTKMPAFSAAAAGEEDVTLDYHYCGDPVSLLATGDGLEVKNSAAIMLPEDVVTRYAGAEIMSVMICSGANRRDMWINNITDASVFVSYNIFDDSPENEVARQRGRLSRSPMTWSEITFKNPYKLEAGKPVFVGYDVIRPDGWDCPFASDGVKMESDCSSWIYYNYNGEFRWENWSALYGSVCLRVKLRGADLPVNDVEVMSLSVPMQVGKGQFNATFRVRNIGANEVSSIGYTCKVGDGSEVEKVFKPSTPLKFSESTDVTVRLTCQDFGLEVPVSVTVTSVNGVEDPDVSNNTQERQTCCLDASMGYTRRFVMEEGTGLWCGNCPRGLGTMEYMNEKYPDTFIGIGIHQGDPMEIDGSKYSGHSYAEHKMMIGTYPNARYNRKDSEYGNSINDFGGHVEGIYKSVVAMPAAADIKADLYFTDQERKEITVKTKTEFALNTSIPFRIALVLVENEVGPYNQSNYYSGVDFACAGWDKMSNPASYVFDEVARYIDHHTGAEGSVPDNKTAKTVYEYQTTLPTEPLKSLDNFDVIALLINFRSGVIENAVKCHGNSNLPLLSAIDEVSAENAARVEVVAGGLNIKGDYRYATVYNTLGSVVAEADGSDFVALSAGLYIVNVDGVAEKVRVR